MFNTVVICVTIFLCFLLLFLGIVIEEYMTYKTDLKKLEINVRVDDKSKQDLHK